MFYTFRVSFFLKSFKNIFCSLMNCSEVKDMLVNWLRLICFDWPQPDWLKWQHWLLSFVNILQFSTEICLNGFYERKQTNKQTNRQTDKQTNNIWMMGYYWQITNTLLEWNGCRFPKMAGARFTKVKTLIS